MPNWAVGTLKIRGTREKILEFCKKELHERANSVHFENDRDRFVEWTMELVDSEYEHGDLTATVHGKPTLCIWMKDSPRNFIEMDTRVPYYWDMDTDGDACVTTFSFYEVNDLLDKARYLVVFPFMAAWGVDEEYFERLSKEYDLIFKVYTVEQGMGFFHEFEAFDGKIKELSSGPSNGPELEKIGGSYGRFVWECPFPFLGG